MPQLRLLRRPRGFLGLALLALGGLAQGQTQAQPQGGATPPGADSIRRIAGCHAVTYRFFEDGAHDHFADKPGLITEIKELIVLTEDGPGRLMLQHASINEEGQPVPHWHEVWTAGPAGWTQAIYSRTPDNPARALRYQCTAPWSINQWHCAAGRATKPFRDSGAPFGFMRTDYEVLDRTNTLLVTPRGWVQSESNRKLDRAGKLVSYEQGFITYRRLDDAQCRTTLPPASP